eukprot:m.80378 g.80378  ORF g.80378 m.80378 type:complete len:168 (-) comp12754_c0_seq2:217-720(-)
MTKGTMCSTRCWYLAVTVIFAVTIEIASGAWDCDRSTHKCVETARGAFPTEEDCKKACDHHSKDPIEEFEALSLGSEILLVFFFGLVTPYVLIGCFINLTYYQRRGLQILPHLEFWKAFGICVIEGIRFTKYKFGGISGPQKHMYRPLMEDEGKDSTELTKSYNTHI